jgi:hypothetical protein
MKMEIECKWNLNVNEPTILNAHKKGGVIRSLQKKYSHPNHETSPFSNMKMQKTKPITKLIMDICLKNSPR